MNSLISVIESKITHKTVEMSNNLQRRTNFTS